MQSQVAARTTGKAYSTTLQYVIRFYPRFMTYFQQRYGKTGINALTGPARVNQKYGLVVAINVDTI